MNLQLQPPHCIRRGIIDLPSNILFPVFLSLVQDEFNTRNYYLRTRYPWILSEVCKDWRDACLDYAILWTYVRLNGHTCPGRVGTWDVGLRRLHLYLERSKNASISVDANAMCSCSGEVTRFRVLLDHAHRWRSVILSVDWWDPISEDDTYFDLDLLKDLIPIGTVFNALTDIYWINSADFYPRISLPLDRTNLPSLRKATFSLLVGYEEIDSFPWNQLESLRLLAYCGNIHQLMEVLHQCQNISYLELAPTASETMIGVARDPVGAGGIIHPDVAHFPHLASLILKKNEGQDLSCLLPSICAPNLKSLIYRASLLPNSLPTFTNFISSCSKTLTDLSMYYSDGYGPQELLTFLKSLQNIRQLRFEKAEYLKPKVSAHCNDFLKAATRTVGTPTSENFPHLQYLGLHELHFDSTLLKRMVESRIGLASEAGLEIDPAPASARLESVGISFSKRETTGAQHHAQAADLALGGYVRDRRLKFEVYYGISAKEA